MSAFSVFVRAEGNLRQDALAVGTGSKKVTKVAAHGVASASNVTEANQFGNREVSARIIPRWIIHDYSDKQHPMCFSCQYYQYCNHLNFPTLAFEMFIARARSCKVYVAEANHFTLSYEGPSPQVTQN